MSDPKDRESQQGQLQVLAAVFGAAAGWTTGLLTDPAGGLIVGAAATEAAKIAIERVSGLRGRQVVAMWEVEPVAGGRLGAVAADARGRRFAENEPGRRNAVFSVVAGRAAAVPVAGVADGLPGGLESAADPGPLPALDGAAVAARPARDLIPPP